MKYHTYFYIALFMASGCQQFSPPVEQSGIASDECPEEAQVRLFAKNLQEIDLSDKLTESAVARRNKTLGYRFQGEKGQKLKYKTESDICIWVYTPDGELLNSSILPKTGKYIIQVSSNQAALPFELAMELDMVKSLNNAPEKPSSSSELNPNQASNQVAVADSEDYSWLSERQVTEADLSGKSAWNLDIMRNEIFARHGRRFRSRELQNYFNQQSWYRPLYSPDDFPVSLLSS